MGMLAMIMASASLASSISVGISVVREKSVKVCPLSSKGFLRIASSSEEMPRDSIITILLMSFFLSVAGGLQFVIIIIAVI